MTTVILLSAHAQHGKDYTANLIKTKLEADGKKVLITHYADLLKYICKTFFNWDGLKNEEGRTLLQKVGTDVIRHKSPNFWVNFIIKIIKFFPNEWDYILIPDTRFPNEITNIKQCKDFNTVSVRIERPNFENSLTDEQRNHESETALDNYFFDFYLTNDNNISENIDKLLVKINKHTPSTIYCDLDCTFFDTISCITRLYNNDYKYYDGYDYINPEEVATWDWKELYLASEEKINEYFNSPRFFDNITYFPYADYAIRKLSDNYNIVFVSKGDSANLKQKEIFIKTRYPFTDFIGISNNEKDKSSVDMSGGIFIDDRLDNLVNSNAEIKICFGKEYPWNKDFKYEKGYYRCYDWFNIDKLINNVRKDYNE